MRKICAINEITSARPSHRTLPKKEEKKEPEKIEIPKFLVKFLIFPYFRPNSQAPISVELLMMKSQLPKRKKRKKRNYPLLSLPMQATSNSTQAIIPGSLKTQTSKQQQ